MQHQTTFALRNAEHHLYLAGKSFLGFTGHGYLPACDISSLASCPEGVRLVAGQRPEAMCRTSLCRDNYLPPRKSHGYLPPRLVA